VNTPFLKELSTLSAKQHATPTSDTSSFVAEQNNTSAAPALAEGLIVDGNRGLYRVETPAGTFLCTIRGRLRKELEYSQSGSAPKRVQKATVKVHDPVAVGDRVRLLPMGGGNGVIEEVVARAGSGDYTRVDPDKGGGKVRSVAGLDQMIPVFAAAQPAPHLRMLDRFLVLAEVQRLAIVICINKVDLGLEPWLAERLDAYRAAGYPLVLTSTETGEGVEALRGYLGGRTSALMGPSGVGKSSLLNALEPELGLKVSEVSALHHKGRHTTTGTRLISLGGPAGGYIADTAGIRALALGDLAEAQLDACFPEFRPFLGTCRLSDCTHLHEPGCAVRAAVRAGSVDRERYDSYCRLCQDGAGMSEEEWNDVV
jgi:ribosome biogenesis GTPase